MSDLQDPQQPHDGFNDDYLPLPIHHQAGALGSASNDVNGRPDDQPCLDALQHLVCRGTDEMVAPAYKINGGRRRYTGRFAGYAWGINLRLERLLNDLDRIEDAVVYDLKTDQQGAVEARHIVHEAVLELRLGAHLQPRFFAPQIPVFAELGNYLATTRRLAEAVSILCSRCGLGPQFIEQE